MSKKTKNLELTGFDPNTGLMSNEEPVQPKITGLGGDKTVSETKVDRHKEVVLSKAYRSNRSRIGAISCLNLILQKCAVSHIDSDRSAQGRFVLVHPLVGDGTIAPAPFCLTTEEWKIVISIAKEYKKSPFLFREISLKRFNNAIQHLDQELYDAYVSAGILPNENQIVTAIDSGSSSTPSGLPSPPVVD